MGNVSREVAGQIVYHTYIYVTSAVQSQEQWHCAVDRRAFTITATRCTICITKFHTQKVDVLVHFFNYNFPNRSAMLFCKAV